MDPWIANESARNAFATYLDTLSPDDWTTTSWSDEWDVKAVAAHLLVTQTKGKGGVFFAFLTSGFNLNKMNAKYVGELTSSLSVDQIIATTKRTAGVRSAPPGLSPIGVFGELTVHATDVSGAVGKPFALAPEDYVLSLDHYKGVEAPLGCKTRIEGLRLRATDVEWSTGDGPLVEGPAQMLVSAMTGRRQALSHLSGDGLDAMSAR
jgi:uncharacterized protein (TIGR03083 family)